MTKKDYYKILGVDRNAEKEVIDYAYRAKAKLYHSDRHPNVNQKSDFDKIMQEINEAYETLRDAERRREYDKSLVAESPSEFSEREDYHYQEETKYTESTDDAEENHIDQDSILCPNCGLRISMAEQVCPQCAAQVSIGNEWGTGDHNTQVVNTKRIFARPSAKRMRLMTKIWLLFFVGSLVLVIVGFSIENESMWKWSGVVLFFTLIFGFWAFVFGMAAWIGGWFR